MLVAPASGRVVMGRGVVLTRPLDVARPTEIAREPDDLHGSQAEACRSLATLLSGFLAAPCEEAHPRSHCVDRSGVHRKPAEAR
jgi:hypothetical protein